MSHVLPVTVVGDVKPDLLIQVPDEPTDVVGSVPRMTGGGTGGNVAAGLARLNVATRMISAVGDDIFGRSVIEELAADGVDVSAIKIVEGGYTPVVIVLIRTDGWRLPLVWPPDRAADKMLDPADIDPALLADSSWLHSSGMMLRHQPARQATLTAMEVARGAGIPVSFDLNLRVELWGLDSETRSAIQDAIELSDVVLGSGDEELIPLTGSGSVEDAVTTLAGGQRMVIGRSGADGVVAAVDGALLKVAVVPANVVDTLGAGDAFDAGFIAGRVNGLDVEAALRWGNAAAAFNVSGPGARFLPSLRQLLEVAGRTA